MKTFPTLSIWGIHMKRIPIHPHHVMAVIKGQLAVRADKGLGNHCSGEDKKPELLYASLAAPQTAKWAEEVLVTQPS